MKKVFFLLVFSLTIVEIDAQGLQVSREFGLNLELWTLTKNIAYRTNIDRICNGEYRTVVTNDLVMDLDPNFFTNKPTCRMETYLNIIDLINSKDSLSIKVFDYKLEDKLHIADRFVSRNINDMDVQYVSCNIKVRGAVSLDTRILIYIRNKKISKIAKYIKE